MTLPPPFDARRQARAHYWAGYDCEQIAEVLRVNANTVRSWKARDGWDETAPLERVETALDARLQLLIVKDAKTGHDFKEIDLLGRQLERTARVRRYEAPGGHEGDLNAKVANRNKGEKKQARRNHLTVEQQAMLRERFETGLFGYQRDWRTDLNASTANVTRMILKSRQIGATFYFAREALIRAIDTGNNQIFISASRAQANIFRQYIQAFVGEVCGVKLEGDPIVLDLDGVSGPEGEPVKLYFLGTNYRTAQGYHGDVYIDECFWIHGFEQLNKVAGAMATHKRYRRTYFSTPSTIAHQAYPMWTGDRFNARRPKEDRVKIDTAHAALRGGVFGADRIWRQIVTLDDAEAKGCDLFDRAELEADNSPDEFANLYGCQFVDDSSSMFPFALMRRAMVDSWDAWSKEFDAYALRPFGDRAVWIGYDPAESAAGDDAALVIVAPPAEPGGKFRVLEKFRMKGLDYSAQAAKIIEQLDRYRVDYIGIDATGCGGAVWQLVVARFPLAKKITYSVEVKTQMVLKAKSVFSAGRVEFDAGWTDVAASFMAIRAELTGSQRQITYTASRAGDTGHADLAWAIMHALANEPLDPGQLGARKSRLRIFGNGQSSDPHAASGPVAWRRDRRDQGFRHAAIARVRVRGRGAGAGPARVPASRAGAVERALVGAADPAAVARAHPPHEPASRQRAQIQGQPAGPLLPAVALADPRRVRQVRARLPVARQRLSAAVRQPRRATARVPVDAGGVDARRRG